MEGSTSSTTSVTPSSTQKGSRSLSYHSPRVLLSPSCLRPIPQQEHKQHYLRSTLHRRNKTFQNANRIVVAPTMQYPSQEIDIPPPHQLLDKEVMLHELDSALLVLQQCFSLIPNRILKALHDKPGIFCSRSQSLWHSSLTSTHTNHDRAWPIDQTPRTPIHRVLQIPASKEPYHIMAPP